MTMRIVMMPYEVKQIDTLSEIIQFVIHVYLRLNMIPETL